MSRTIHKYTLMTESKIFVNLIVFPKGAKILAVGNQHERFVLWAEIDPRAAPERRSFVVYGTGHPMPDDPGTYLGTASFADGTLVLHAYETKGA